MTKKKKKMDWMSLTALFISLVIFTIMFKNWDNIKEFIGNLFS